MNDKNNMLALSQERFSARKFTPEAVSQEDLDYIMECVRLAPSAVNRQPWRWLIVRLRRGEEETAGLLRPRMVQDGSYIYYRYEKRE